MVAAVLAGLIVIVQIDRSLLYRFGYKSLKQKLVLCFTTVGVSILLLSLFDSNPLIFSVFALAPIAICSVYWKSHLSSTQSSFTVGMLYGCVLSLMVGLAFVLLHYIPGPVG